MEFVSLEVYMREDTIGCGGLWVINISQYKWFFVGQSSIFPCHVCVVMRDRLRNKLLSGSLTWFRQS